MLTCFQENTNLPTTLLSRLPISLSKRNENLALDFFFFFFFFFESNNQHKRTKHRFKLQHGKEMKIRIRKNRLLP